MTKKARVREPPKYRYRVTATLSIPVELFVMTYSAEAAKIVVERCAYEAALDQYDDEGEKVTFDGSRLHTPTAYKVGMAKIKARKAELAEMEVNDDGRTE